MIDERTGRPSPCPTCGSSDVRWRRRHWYDEVRTWLAYAVQWPFWQFGRMGAPRPRYEYRSFNTPDATDVDRQSILLSPEDFLRDNRYAQLRHRYDQRMGTMTAATFWRCASCGSGGAVFDVVSDEFGAMRSELASLEDQIAESGGVIAHPIDRDGVARREPEHGAPS